MPPITLDIDMSCLTLSHTSLQYKWYSVYLIEQQCLSAAYPLTDKQSWLTRSKNTIDVIKNSADFAIDDNGVFGIDFIFASVGESLFEWLEVSRKNKK